VVWQDYEDDLGLTVEQLDNANASMLAGLALGCLFFIPFALKFGRRPVYIITTLICFLTTVWQATLTTYSSMIACQVLSGLAGAVSETLVQLSVSLLSSLVIPIFTEFIQVADIFFVHERGTMNSIYLMFLNVGVSEILFECYIHSQHLTIPLIGLRGPSCCWFHS
jgi:MFS family permease